jgi:3-oxoacyl-[acyl-carrier protein] reductase
MSLARSWLEQYARTLRSGKPLWIERATARGVVNNLLESLRARRETAAYAAAKTALLVYARSLALEEASHGVRVNVVSPGLVPHADASEDTRDPERIARVPLGRATTADEVAGVVSWLCSNESALVTGQNVEVAGGWLL